MVQIKEGKLIGSGIKVGIVVARFNEFICSVSSAAQKMPSNVMV